MARGLIGYGLALALASAAAKENATGQDFLVHNWDYDEGLPSTCINTVVRTSDGYVWLATRHGLARFDGLRFVNFNYDNTPVLQDNRMISLATDRQGTLWIGTENGHLARFAQGKFAAVDLGDTTRQHSVVSIVADAEGNAWLGTDGAGLIRLKDGKVETFTTTNGLPSLTVVKLLADPQGRIWYLAAPGKLGWMEAGQCHVADKSAGLPAFIRALALARDGGLWLAAQKDPKGGTRIYKFKGGLITEETQAYPWTQSSWRSRPGALLEDQAGNLWCGTLGAGVFFRPTGGSWQKLEADLPFSQAETMCLVADEGDSVWIGTRTSGLHQAVPRPLSTYYLPTANFQNALLTVCVRHDGSIWGGTDGTGIFRRQNSPTNRLGEQPDFAGVQVNALLEDSRSNFWAGTSAGLFHFEAGQFKLLENLGEHSAVDALYETPQGRLWAGTSSGLLCINEDAPQKKFDQSSGLPVGTIQAILQDAAGRLWTAIQGQGVFRQDGNRFALWSPKGGPIAARERWSNGVRVRSLLPETDGTIWAVTHGDGLFLLAGDQIRTWNWENDGLPSNHMFALQADGAGNLWVSSENGIFGYAKQALLNYRTGNTPPIPWRLTQADGLPYKVCSGGGQPAATQSADGRLWFPDGSALVAFDPNTLPREMKTWPPVIEEIRVDGQPLPVLSRQPIRVTSGARSFEFHFTSPNLLMPIRLRFRYRLEGLENNWNPEGTLRSARYSRLPPGDYTFRVMASNNYGVWNENDAALRLTIVPRFWEAKWFQISLGLCLLGSVGLVARQIERASNRRKLTALEHERALERERTLIARDIHDDLGASLTEVALLGDMAGDKMTSPDELRAQTRKISTAAREMAQSLEAIVWAVRPENDSLCSLVEYMNRRTDELFEKIPRQYQFNVPAKIPECCIHAEVRHNVFLAYKEALTNSLKHAQASMVCVELSCDQSRCQITISDNGKGFASETMRSGGTGLKNMRQRMEEIGGGFEMESQPDQGTTIRLYFPLPHLHLS